MSEDQIAELVKSALSVLKATDTFAWLTTDAATSLNNRAQTKLALLTDFETQLTPRISDTAVASYFRSVLERSRSEAQLQMKVAQFLKDLPTADAGRDS